MPDLCIVSACDAGMERLAQDLCCSLGSYSSLLHMIDIGMTAGAREWFASRNVPVIPYQAPDAGIVFAENYYKALFIRPFLPGLLQAKTILWIDADCWVQDVTAIDSFRQRAEGRPGAFAICPMVDAEYPRCISAYAGYHNHYRDTIYAPLFGDSIAEFLYCRAVFSAGVFCATAGSPVWQLWEMELRRIYGDLRPSGGLGHIAEQATLNRFLHESGMFEALPADHNWHCHCSTVERRGEKVAILPSGREPKIVHLCDFRAKGIEYREGRLLYEPPIRDTGTSVEALPI